MTDPTGTADPADPADPAGTDGQAQPLTGGMMNSVHRQGEHVVRTAPPAAPALHDHLRAVAAHGFDGAPAPVRLRTDGREELTFVHGDVALPPFPDWARTDDALRSTARLLRRYHRAAADVPVETSAPWATALADPQGGPLLCHNDPCLENIVFRDGRAAALIDFDLAAPGRALWDVAALAYYMVPMLDPVSAAYSPHPAFDVPHRLRVLADAYGLGLDPGPDPGPADRRSLPETVEQYTAVARAFVAGKVADGDPAFVRSLERLGGWERWDRRQRWLARQRPVFVDALTA